MLPRLTMLLCLLALAVPGLARAGGGNYVFAGGTATQQGQVRAALDASAFDWSLVRQQVTIHVGRGGDSYSTPGHIWLDANLLDSDRFSWATVQHEYGHQVDFFLLDDAKRAQLNAALGGKDWCYGVAGLRHADYGCERFASLISWAYWPSADNAFRPASSRDEAGALPAAAFRALLATMIGAPRGVSTLTATAYAPKPKRRR